jgi:hypothetical protein
VADPQGVVQTSLVTLQGRELFIVQIVGASTGLVGQAARVEGALDSEFGRFFALDTPVSTQARLLPGLPLADGTWFDALVPARDDRTVDALFVREEVSERQPLRIDLAARDGERTVELPPVIGFTEPIPTGNDVLIYVQIAPTRPEDADRFGGGRWLMRLGTSPILWERLPYPDMTDELEHRHLAVGPDGSIHLMLLKEDGVDILRRP